jgi:predicted CoA-binding protein
MKTIVILGASDNPDRYSNKAFRLLRERRYHVVPVNPALGLRLHAAGIRTIQACSLVLLTTGRFDEATS